MESLFTEAHGVVAAFWTNDAWEIREALATSGAWPAGLGAMLVAAGLLLVVYRLIPFVDQHLERTVMVWSYLIIAGVIFVEVFRRFVLSQQVPWSTTLPPFLFLIMTWFGCSLNIRLRSHLAFSEFRLHLGRRGQLACLILDAVLWLGFCWVVVVTSARVTANSAANFQILLGTNDVLQWWFLISVPIAFTLMATRVVENLIDDINNYRSGRPLIKLATIGAD
ncbi:MAG: TRAP transporter small permease [Candidatus Competibacterales bacterium]